MSNKNTNEIKNNSVDTQSRIINPPPVILPDDYPPIVYTIDTSTVQNNTGTISTGSIAYCDSERHIRCDINITSYDTVKFKNIKRALLVLKQVTGSGDTFEASLSPIAGVLEGEPFAYTDARYNSSGNVTHRVVDITSLIKNAESQSISIAITSLSGAYCSVYTSSESLEIEYIADDDFIPNVSKLEKRIGAKGVYSANLRNGKLFYTQNLINGKGGRMPFALSMTYNAADCDTNSPNGFSSGIKGWTFNYEQTLNTTENNYVLLDGAHKYRIFKPSGNNSAIKFDSSGKNGAFLTENATGYTISDGKAATYTFDTKKRLIEIKHAKGSSPIVTAIAYDSNGRISTVTDGMGDSYNFVYGANTITVSKGEVSLVELTLTDERLVQVKYLLSNEIYTFTYNTNGELTSVSDNTSNEKVAFEYDSVHSVNAIKNYIVTDGTALPTDCYFIDYSVLETRVAKCKNSTSEYAVYTTTIYMFAENGETIFVSENLSNGVFKNMRFRTKNDYEKYSADIIDLASTTSEKHYGVFGFGEYSFWDCVHSELDGTYQKDSNILLFDTSDYTSENFIFSAKARVDANSYIKNDGTQSAKIYLKENDTVLATLEFDLERREYQVKSALVRLPRGEHNLKAEFYINNTRANIQLSDLFIFETQKGGTYEYITDFYDDANVFEEDQTTRWYLNKNKLKLVCGGVEYSDIKYTFKDYLLTTISRLKNPDSFNVWYNDGESMLAQVNLAILTNDSASKDIAGVKCCQMSGGIGKTAFTTAGASTVSGGLIQMSNIIKVHSNPVEFYYSTNDYNVNMQLIRSKNEDDIVVEYTYNDFGEVVSEKTFPSANTPMNILVSKTYQGGNLASVTEKRYETEYTKIYEYDSDNILTHEITANGQYIHYTHTPDGEKLTELKTDVGGMNENDISYTGNLVSGLEHNNTAITFEYDERNAVNCVKVEGTTILSKEITYTSGENQTLTTYGNGVKIKKYYDTYNRLIKVTEIIGDIELAICTYIYSDSEVADNVTAPNDESLDISAGSKLRVFIDNTANKRTKYIYDEFGALKEKQTGDIREYISEKDAFNRTAKTVFTDGVKSIENSFEYENSNSDRVTNETVSVDGASIDISYNRDALKRMSYITTTENGTGYIRTFGYVPRGTEGTTGYIEKMYIHKVIDNVPTLERIDNVAYNADGNIITYAENTYVYDNLGRLIRENNKNLDKTFTFVYNVGGNIVSKNEYVYTTGELGTPTKVYNYSYGNTWKDQLTSFDGSSITYDAIGNPTSYLGAALTWSKGRLLTRYVNGDKTVTMQYDAKGIRRFKQAPALIEGYKYTLYVYDNEGRLRAETTNVSGTNFRYYLYSSDGIIGYEENGERFLYRKNLFGDITAIYKGTTKVAEYEYDAWGNCTITLDTNGVGTNNPFRYRGYYWDNDIKLYYLMSRYYDPKTGRFINADTFDYLEPKAINGLNLYAYCRNNPVMQVDPSGSESSSFDTDDLEILSIIPLIFYSAYLIYRIISGESRKQLNLQDVDLWGDDFYDPHWGGWKPITPDSSSPILFPTKGVLLNLVASIVRADVFLDSYELSSFYFSLIDLSAFVGMKVFDEDGVMIGAFAGLGLLNLGYDGMYVDIEVNLIGVGAGVGWNDGKLRIKKDPIGWLGVDLSLDIGKFISDLQK